jgi:hypothetical protein
MSINLGSCFLPIAIFVSVWSYNVSVRQITIEFCIACCFCVYIIILSIMSPCPVLLNSIFGPLFSVLSWILSQGLFVRVRCLISARLERFGERVLLISGAMTLVGEVIGGIIMFFLIEKLRLFKEQPECIFDKDITCPNYQF